MDKLKDIARFIFSGIFVGLILVLPIIGFTFYIIFELFWIKVLYFIIVCILIELYGKYYYKFNKLTYKKETKLKIHHDVENNIVWIESNDTIDSIIDIEIVKHANLKE